MFKKYIILTFLTILMVSCGSDDTVTISKKEYEQLIGDTLKQGYPKEISWLNSYNESRTAYVVKIENHEFLTGWGSTGYTYFLIHYPDCKFCKKDTLNYK